MAAPMATLRSSGIHRLIIELISGDDPADQGRLSVEESTIA
jgi:hypothetical protein